MDTLAQEKVALYPASQWFNPGRRLLHIVLSGDRTFVDVDDLPAQLRIDHDYHIRR